MIPIVSWLTLNAYYMLSTAYTRNNNIIHKFTIHLYSNIPSAVHSHNSNIYKTHEKAWLCDENQEERYMILSIE